VSDLGEDNAPRLEDVQSEEEAIRSLLALAACVCEGRLDAGALVDAARRLPERFTNLRARIAEEKDPALRRKSLDVYRHLKAELARAATGRRYEINIDALDGESLRNLLRLVRDLKSDRDQEKRKRSMGIIF
jgi:hypothetical protein